MQLKYIFILAIFATLLSSCASESSGDNPFETTPQEYDSNARQPFLGNIEYSKAFKFDNRIWLLAQERLYYYNDRNTVLFHSTDAINWFEADSHLTSISTDVSELRFVEKDGKLIMFSGPTTINKGIFSSSDGLIFEKLNSRELWNDSFVISGATVFNDSIFVYGPTYNSPLDDSFQTNNLWRSSDAINWQKVTFPTASSSIKIDLYSAAVVANNIYIRGVEQVEQLVTTDNSNTPTVTTKEVHSIWQSNDGSNWSLATTLSFGIFIHEMVAFKDNLYVSGVDNILNLYKLNVTDNLQSELVSSNISIYTTTDFAVFNDVLWSLTDCLVDDRLVYSHKICYSNDGSNWQNQFIRFDR